MGVSTKLDRSSPNDHVDGMYDLMTMFFFDALNSNLLRRFSIFSRLASTSFLQLFQVSIFLSCVQTTWT